MVRRSCWDLMVRRMLLVVVVLEIGFDERPFVHLRIEIGVYGVRGIRDASICQPRLTSGKSERGGTNLSSEMICQTLITIQHGQHSSLLISSLVHSIKSSVVLADCRITYASLTNPQLLMPTSTSSFIQIL